MDSASSVDPYWVPGACPDVAAALALALLGTGTSRRGPTRGRQLRFRRLVLSEDGEKCVLILLGALALGATAYLHLVHARGISEWHARQRELIPPPLRFLTYLNMAHSPEAVRVMGLLMALGALSFLWIGAASLLMTPFG